MATKYMYYVDVDVTELDGLIEDGQRLQLDVKVLNENGPAGGNYLVRLRSENKTVLQSWLSANGYPVEVHPIKPTLKGGTPRGKWLTRNDQPKEKKSMSLVKRPTPEQQNQSIELGQQFVDLAKKTFPQAFDAPWLEAFEPAELESDLRAVATDCMFHSIEPKEE